MTLAAQASQIGDAMAVNVVALAPVDGGPVEVEPAGIFDGA